MSSVTKYAALAEELARLITSGELAPGARLPSMRQQCERRRLSQATVLQAYALLESRGLIESRPRSGYFVARQRPSAAVSRPAPESVQVDVSELVFHILGATRERRLLPFGSAFPSPLLFPMDRLARSLARSARRLDPWASVADLPPGSTALRQLIARRYLTQGMAIPVDGILITHGAMEALNLALQAVAPPGSLVAVESPCFYGALQAIERLGLRAVEIPIDPVDGLDLESLRRTLDTQPVRACWFMSSFQNPTGLSVPDPQRAAIVRLLAERDVPLIEDDVYAELYFGRTPPQPYKFFDQGGRVLHCGGYAKCLAPGYRVGWIAAGRYATAVERLKLGTTLATSIPIQEALADYLERGGYDLHLRRLRQTLKAQQEQMLDLIAQHFPAGSRATRAQGGYFTWVELPTQIDTLELHRLAAAEGIGLSPGPMFSAKRAFKHCMRLNYGHPWTPELIAGMQRLGALARQSESGRSHGMARPR